MRLAGVLTPGACVSAVFGQYVVTLWGLQLADASSPLYSHRDGPSGPTRLCLAFRGPRLACAGGWAGGQALPFERAVFTLKGAIGVVLVQSPGGRT